MRWDTWANAATFALLLIFAVEHQCVRNRERYDSRISAAAILFQNEDSGETNLHREVETVDEFLDVFRGIVESYYAAPRRSTGSFMHYLNSTDEQIILRPQLLLRYHAGYYGSPEFDTINEVNVGLARSMPLGPFEDPSELLGNTESCKPTSSEDQVAYISCRGSALGELIDRLVELRVSYQLRSLRSLADGSVVAGSWTARFDFTLSGHNSVMAIAGSLDSEERRQPRRIPVLTACFLAVLALLSVCSKIGIKLRASFLANVVRGRPSHDVVNDVVIDPAASIAPSERENIGTTQNLCSLAYIANLVVLAFSVTSLFNQFRTTSNSSLEEAVTLLLAFAVFSTCILLVTFFQAFPKVYIPVDAFFIAMNQLSMYAVAIFPLLLGYAICGTAVYSGYGGYFNSIPRALITLVCAVFGDNLIDTFLEMDQSVLLGQVMFTRVFIMTFLAIFICSILSIAHNVVQDSFALATRMLGSHGGVGDGSVKDENELDESGAAPLSIQELQNILALIQQQ